MGVLGGLRNVARSEGAGEGFESADQDTFFWGIECGAWRDVFFWLFILFSFAFYNSFLRVLMHLLHCRAVGVCTRHQPTPPPGLAFSFIHRPLSRTRSS